jgi:hypothetical protein
MDAIRRTRNGSILVGGVGSGKSRTSLGYFFKENGGGFSPVTEDVENGGKKIVGYDIKKEMVEKPRDLIIITTSKKRDSYEWEEELTHFSMSTQPEVNKYKNEVVVDSWNNIGKYSKAMGAFFIFDEQRVGGTGKWAKLLSRSQNKTIGYCCRRLQEIRGQIMLQFSLQTDFIKILQNSE